MTPETAGADPRARIPRAWLAGVFLLPTLLMWRGDGFYIGDDWILLARLVSVPFRSYMFSPDAEHWSPLFLLTYAGLVRWAGENGAWLLLFNCFLCGVNALLVLAFLRRHLSSPSVAAALAAVYAASGANSETAFTAQVANFAFGMALYLAALLQANSCCRGAGPWRLAALGGTALVCLLFHNFPVLLLAGLPAYVWLAHAGVPRRRAAAVACAVFVPLVLFAAGHLTFAGMAAVRCHDTSVFRSLPGPAYAAHLAAAALLSPALYFFWGHYHFPIWDYAAAAALMAGCALVLAKLGRSPERRAAAWAAAANVLPFVLVSLGRYHRAVSQAFVARYTTYTLIGLLLVVGLAWEALVRRSRRPATARAVGGVLVVLLLALQLPAHARWRAYYGPMFREAREYYDTFPAAAAATPRDAPRAFMPERHPGLTGEQKAAIRRLLAQ
jgi:hypothetical protein